MPQLCCLEFKLSTAVCVCVCVCVFFFWKIMNSLSEHVTYGRAGPNGIVTLLFINRTDHLALNFSTIFYILIKEGCFSTFYRVGSITPVFKCGSFNTCHLDYLPITVTLVLFRFFECLLVKSIQGYLDVFAEKNNLSRNFQFSFRKGLGTCDALLTNYQSCSENNGLCL